MLAKLSPTLSCSSAGFCMVYSSNLQLGEGESLLEESVLLHSSLEVGE